MKTVLRYPGGKSRARKILYDILTNHFDISGLKTLISPFFGGGSFELFIHEQYGCNIVANDLFEPLYCFWNEVKHNKTELCNKLHSIHSTNNNINDLRSLFFEYRNNIMNEEDTLKKALQFFFINRCSFSGSTLSGGFSEQSAKTRFTKSCIDRIHDLDLLKFTFSNEDAIKMLNKITDEHTNNDANSFVFLDPPYFIGNKSKLYGKNGDMHSTFDHRKLFDAVSKLKVQWMLTYNDCDDIREMYKDYKILPLEWAYSMNKSKKSSEIVILGI